MNEQTYYLTLDAISRTKHYNDSRQLDSAMLFCQYQRSFRAINSVARVLPSHGRSHRFKSCIAHHSARSGGRGRPQNLGSLAATPVLPGVLTLKCSFAPSNMWDVLNYGLLVRAMAKRFDCVRKIEAANQGFPYC